MITHHWRVEHIPTGIIGDVVFRDHGIGGSDFSIDMAGDKKLNHALFKYLTTGQEFIVPAKVPKGATCGMQTIRARPVRNVHFFCAAMSMLPGGEGTEDFRMICHVEEEVPTRRRHAA